jgi:hypothetical protein
MITKLFLCFTCCLKSFSGKVKFVFLFIFFLSTGVIAKGITETQKYIFVYSDNALKTGKLKNVYLINSNKKHKSITDTIKATNFNPTGSDTIYFYSPKVLMGHYQIEFAFDNFKKTSNKVLLFPGKIYLLTELDDQIKIKSRILTFDFLEYHAKILYTFLIHLLIELLLAFPLAMILKLPMRLYFFVLVANIMSFPVQYIPFIPMEMKEVLTIILEGVFISLIGWKRLKFSRAMLVSLILNVLRFGIAKAVLLFIKIY